MRVGLVWVAASVLAAACGGASGRAGDGGPLVFDGGSSFDGGPAPDGGGLFDGGAVVDGGGSVDGGGLLDGGPDGGATDGGVACPRDPAPADRSRRVVISHPYDASGAQANAYEVLSLSTAGVLTTTGERFAMGRAGFGEIAFTPDGKIGLVAQDDGTLGAFRFDDAGLVAVVHARFEGSFYASAVIVDPLGSHAWVLDSNWRNNGGGLYRVEIACDGALTDSGLVFPSKLLHGMRWVPGRPDRVVLAARDVLDSPVGDDAHLVAWGTAPVVRDGADAFGDDEAVVSALAVTADGAWVLVGDNAGFSGIPNRIAVASLKGDVLSGVQVLSPVEDPVAIVASPWANTVLVVSGFGDAVFRLDFDETSPSAPFKSPVELAYSGSRPQLPGAAIPIERGTLRGRVLVAELLGVRQLRFETDGPVTDLGHFAVGSGNAAIVGAIGVQP